MEIAQGNSLCSHLYLKQVKMSFSLYFIFLFYSAKLENKRVEQVLPIWMGITSVRGGWWGKGVGG
jgi:hypothetical protein